jgi:hypothetical protein
LAFFAKRDSRAVQALIKDTYRVDADVVAAFEHRRYTGLYGNIPLYDKGIEFVTDAGNRVVNWPEQSHSNGVNKNDLTSRKYKASVRILKRLRNKMQEEGIIQAKDIGSYLIASLVWNVPNEQFNSTYHVPNIRNVLAHTFNNTLNDEACGTWGEVNELKYLFNPTQGWTRQQAHDFLSAAWDYMGLE